MGFDLPFQQKDLEAGEYDLIEYVHKRSQFNFVGIVTQNKDEKRNKKNPVP